MIAWFEIPVSDMKRAKAFYESVLAIEIKEMDFGGLQMGWFPPSDSGTGTGSLMKHESYIPSEEGTLVYFACDDVAVELGRVEAAGGKIYLEKTKISDEHGFMGVFIDTEGNRVALHSIK